LIETTRIYQAAIPTVVAAVIVTFVSAVVLESSIIDICIVIVGIVIGILDTAGSWIIVRDDCWI